jgi:cytochrome c biogenesis factor
MDHRGISALCRAYLQPVQRLDPAPLEGNDLNPILQDIGLAIHPPLLYLGYVGFSISFPLPSPR